MRSYTLINDTRFRVSSSVASFLNPETMEMVDNTEFAKSWLTLETDTELIIVASSETPDAYFCIVKTIDDNDEDEVCEYSGIILREAQFTKLEENSVLTDTIEDVEESPESVEAAA